MPDRVLHPLVELTLARLREFVREPEAVFWTFVFPLVLALALGIAFRSKGDAPVFAGVVEGAGSAEVVGGAGRVARRPRPGCSPEGRAARALRDGEVEVVVVPGTPPTYRFDPTRPESQRARLAVDARAAARGRAGGHVHRARAAAGRGRAGATSTGSSRACSA